MTCDLSAASGGVHHSSGRLLLAASRQALGEMMCLNLQGTGLESLHAAVVRVIEQNPPLKELLVDTVTASLADTFLSPEREAYEKSHLRCVYAALSPLSTC